MAFPLFGGQRDKVPDPQSRNTPEGDARVPSAGTALAPVPAPFDKPFEICRPGKFVDASGMPVELTEAGLRDVATGYNVKLRRAPLVLGHPKMDDPAFGWAKELDYRDGALVAVAEQVNKDFAAAVQDGSYSNRSASFYLPDSPNNPTPGRLYLKHVGFLGARQPAVDGLKPLEFSALEGDDALDLVVSMAGWEAAYRHRVRREVEAEHAVSMAAMERQHQRNKQMQEVGVFFDAMLKKAILRGTEREAFVALAESLIGDDSEIQFGEGDDQERSCAWDLLKRLVEHRAPLVMLGEFTGRGGPPSDTVSLAMPNGVHVDRNSAATHNAAVAYQQHHNCSYRDAVRAVTGYQK